MFKFTSTVTMVMIYAAMGSSTTTAPNATCLPPDQLYQKKIAVFQNAIKKVNNITAKLRKKYDLQQQEINNIRMKITIAKNKLCGCVAKDNLPMGIECPPKTTVVSSSNMTANKTTTPTKTITTSSITTSSTTASTMKTLYFGEGRTSVTYQNVSLNFTTLDFNSADHSLLKTAIRKVFHKRQPNTGVKNIVLLPGSIIAKVEVNVSIAWDEDWKEITIAVQTLYDYGTTTASSPVREASADDEKESSNEEEGSRASLYIGAGAGVAAIALVIVGVVIAKRNSSNSKKGDLENQTEGQCRASAEGVYCDQPIYADIDYGVAMQVAGQENYAEPDIVAVVKLEDINTPKVCSGQIQNVYTSNTMLEKSEKTAGEEDEDYMYSDTNSQGSNSSTKRPGQLQMNVPPIKLVIDADDAKSESQEDEYYDMPDTPVSQTSSGTLSVRVVSTRRSNPMYVSSVRHSPTAHDYRNAKGTTAENTAAAGTTAENTAAAGTTAENTAAATTALIEAETYAETSGNATYRSVDTSGELYQDMNNQHDPQSQSQLQAQTQYNVDNVYEEMDAQGNTTYEAIKYDDVPKK